MRLYRYRSIENALKEIEDGTFYFASHDELNDPIEGYIKVFWQGDRFAWEGLLRNYIYNLAIAIFQYLRGDLSSKMKLIISMDQMKDIPFRDIVRDLGKTFLNDSEINSVINFYGQPNFKVSKAGLKMLLYLIQIKALKLCISNYSEINIIPREDAKNILEFLSCSKISRLPFDKMLKNPTEAEVINIISQIFCNLIEDEFEFRCLKLNLDTDKKLNGNDRNFDKNQRRNWLNILVDFPKLYVNQLVNMMYPESFVVCFSRNNNNSAMWGNYAENHKGICFIYETEELSFEVKPILYEGSLVERNFFETFGRYTLPEIKSFLTGADGTISSSFEAFKNEEQWRNEYWENHEIKTYQKLKEWEYEEEYRIVLTGTITDFSRKESRILTYNRKCLRGIIFGIGTSEDDKKRIMEKLAEHKNEYSNFEFWQAEFNDESQSICIREKRGWKI